MKYLRYFISVFLLSILALQAFFFLQILVWRWVNPSVTAFQLAERHRLCGWSIPYIHSCGIKQEWIEFKKISPYLKRAITISEDSDFYRHAGFEPQAMKDAWDRNQKTASIYAVVQPLLSNWLKTYFCRAKKITYARCKSWLLLPC